LLAIACSLSTRSQRILETVLDPANSQFQNTAFAGRVLIAGNSDSFLLNYNDLAFSRANYPVVSGVRLRFNTHNNPLTVFQSAVFFTLTRTSGSTTNRYLYRYTGGTSFSRITISGNIISNTIVYGSYLYFLCDVSGTVRLYRYSSGVVSEVTGAAIPNSNGHKLHVAGSYMYITGYAYYTGTVNFIRRYSGTGFFTLPWTESGTNADGVFAVPGTTRVYFTSHERILYYNGSSVSQVFFNAGESVYPRMWGSNLYFTTGVGASPSRVSRLYRLSGATLTLLSLPTGYSVAPMGSTNPEIYSGALYIGAVHTDGSKRVLRYNGTTYTPFFDITDASLNTGVHLFLREGNLIIHPNYVNGYHAYEYNGTEFTEIIAPAGRYLFPYINSTACNHLWLNYYSDAAGIHFAYARESKGCTTTPPGPMPVIPDHFKDYERFEMTTYGPERGWCWSEIIIDWDIEPVCQLPPCPDPGYQARMMDANNSVVWSAQVFQPGSFPVQLTDQQPFKTVLFSPDAQRDVLVFEPDLLPMGIEIITVKFQPKQNFFQLTASTRNNASVPLKATLLNANGKVLWEQPLPPPCRNK